MGPLTCGVYKEWKSRIIKPEEYTSKIPDMEGGKTRSNYLIEMFNWFYRYTFGRKLCMEKAQTSKIAKAMRNEAKARPFLKWRASTRSKHHVAWRSTRRQEGKIWK